MSVKKYLKRVGRYLLKGIPENHITANIVTIAPNELLKGRKIIVTGGSRGLGYAMAKRFVEQGANVLITGRNQETLKQSAEQINCKYLVLDVHDVNLFQSFIDNSNVLLGGFDSLVCNAGISLHEKDFFHITEQSFEAQINTNLKSNVFLAQKFIGFAIQRNIEANILFISSEVGELADNRPYGWTKAALNSLVRGLASNFAGNGIRVNAISPGITCSDMTGLNSNGNLYIPTNATKRAYLPEEITEVATFMLSDCSKCISGQVIVCNNGKTIYTREKIEKHG
ncbi:SDR family oxidoreductase [Bacteroides gallinaceum]|uniref:SDR family oxidoreductase n=1 Tax=Bacteroides gallinaceum TaxID=1462571 RepID=A0ABT7X3V8_9BACE|nr:SDR family oxidoreductase [Bacteroides gallinaceum]MDN0048734.1 SDR family oxidoreductase [Bacteroides gallinaceum]MDN0080060.1 SDR family oxidoreductase [Bacteroides gallinaceum]